MIKCRKIDAADLSGVADLLNRGFPTRGLQFWRKALDRLSHHEPPAGLPRYGYLMEADGRIVGAILVICAAVPSGGALRTRCNLSSWYVEPGFRAYAPLLVAHAMQHKKLTYLNISAAPHTWPIIEAQGFSRYANGLFVCVPALKDLFSGRNVTLYDARKPPAIVRDRIEQDMLVHHADHGCIAVWCVAPDGAYPFIFRPRLVKRIAPCAQLIYAGAIEDFVRFAGPLGRYLAWRGLPLVLMDAEAPVPGLVGRFQPGSKPKYFKGPQRPRLGDLAYTEYAILGV